MAKEAKILIGILIITIIGFGGWWVLNNNSQLPEENSESQCVAAEMIFYYRDGCPWCQKVKDEGTIPKIEELGVKVDQVNTVVGPIRHELKGVPTFVINEKVYSGHRTLEELKELLGCK